MPTSVHTKDAVCLAAAVVASPSKRRAWLNDSIDCRTSTDPQRIPLSQGGHIRDKRTETFVRTRLRRDKKEREREKEGKKWNKAKNEQNVC